MGLTIKELIGGWTGRGVRGESVRERMRVVLKIKKTIEALSKKVK